MHNYIIMNWRFILTTITLLQLDLSTGRRRLPPYAPGNTHDQYECQNLCSFGYFNCDCEKPRAEYIASSRCVPVTWMCDGYQDCEDGSDEFQCSCQEEEIQCSVCDRGSGCSGNVTFDLYHCAPKYKLRDGEKDCLSLKDEPRRSFECNRCDGILDCPHLNPHDEANCSSCPTAKPLRCACNNEFDITCKGRGQVCYSNSEKCDRSVDCTDASDEIDCPCSDEEFMCQCYQKSPKTCYGQERCIPMRKYHDGNLDCPDGSDETQYFRSTECGSCNMTIYRFQSKLECVRLTYPSCDSTTCYTVPSLDCNSNDCSETQVICTSYCPSYEGLECGPGFQCADGSLALAHQFCDGHFDCPDNSDEISNQPGLECSKPIRKCILPQRNLFDVVPHCDDKRDLCFSQNQSCFQCFDNQLFIADVQVCNGVIDCLDASDECMCDQSAENPACQYLFNTSAVACGSLRRSQSSIPNSQPKNLPLTDTIIQRTFQIECQAKWEMVLATLCDGRPECNDFSDECNCENPPSFCFDDCHSFYLLGDRYCDGVEDEAWMFINNSYCPRGFDERYCPKRLQCNAKDRISIDVGLICNGIKDCDDGSDEINCTQSVTTSIFSSQAEMIENVGIRCIYWILSIAAICGNVYVVVSVALSLRKEKMKEAMRYQYFVMLNIAIADFIMGIYLLTVAIQSIRFSRTYGAMDYEWRTSSACSAIGSFVLISSEASCFFMVILTTFLLFNVCRPPSGTTSNVGWKICVGFGWICAIILATVPTFASLSDYFTRFIWLTTPFTKRTLWTNEEVEEFACRLSSISNNSEEFVDWPSLQSHLESNFPTIVPRGDFGFFSYTSICIPEIYVSQGSYAWEYILALITINYICFMAIAVNYFIICKVSSKRSQGVEDEISANKESELQRRIARIIFTNLVCWITISIIAYVSLGGTPIDNVLYVISVVFLLPINSAVNPFLFSSLPEKLIKLLCCKKMEKVRLF